MKSLPISVRRAIIQCDKQRTWWIETLSRIKSYYRTLRYTAHLVLHTTKIIIEKYLSSLNDISWPGISSVPVVLLKFCSQAISSFLCELFNDFVSSCKFPNEFIFALVSPLFKRKGPSTDMNNYRAISVLQPICKIFEKILAEQFRLYFCRCKQPRSTTFNRSLAK